MDQHNQETAAKPPVPFFSASFWILFINNIRLKWQHRRRRGAAYTDHLKRFYTRSYTSHVESYGDAYARIRPELVRLAGVMSGARVLDVATGGGYQAAAFARAGCQVFGMDYVHDRARLADEQHQLQVVTWGAGDASRLPFGPDAFDVVSISLALHDMPLETQMGALREMRRVARRRVVIVEPHAPRKWLLRWLYIHIGNLIDESLHFGDYVRRPFESHLAETGLKLTETRHVFHNLLKVYVCEPA